MNIYLDFDRTLFDTDHFYPEMEKIVVNNGINLELFNDYKDKLKDRGFNPRLILDALKKEKVFDEKVYLEIDKMIEKSYQYLYDDVIGFLKEMQKQGYHLYILSMGNEEYQRKKIKCSGIIDYFDDIIVTLKLKGELNLDYQHSIFIDDSLKEVESILARHPYRVYQIVRCPIPLSKQVPQIATLNDLLNNSTLFDK